MAFFLKIDLIFRFIVFNVVSFERNKGNEPLRRLSDNDKYVSAFRLTILDGTPPCIRLFDKSRYLKLVILTKIDGDTVVNLLKDKSKYVNAYSSPIADGMVPCIPNALKFNTVGVIVPLLHVTPVHRQGSET